ncbi:MAG TPA: GNAT family N-acetyltransferase [Steroidobacteraceae bacterium]|jgi:GNAT superfamily N-acetyltransferase|nr:GNAT family N-acetyltransferase [Steroidobacteraceae bacterium]
MSSPIQFVPVTTPQQLDVIAGLAREIWYEYYVPLIGRAQVDYMVSTFQSSEAMAQQMRDGYEYFMTERDGRSIGYCAVQAQAAQGSLFVSKLYLLRDARGAGTGRVCMEFIEQLARRRGLSLLWLTVNKGNPAVKAYERLGFRIAADLVMDIGGGYVMDDFRMEKQLH